MLVSLLWVVWGCRMEDSHVSTFWLILHTTWRLMGLPNHL